MLCIPDVVNLRIWVVNDDFGLADFYYESKSVAIRFEGDGYVSDRKVVENKI